MQLNIPHDTESFTCLIKACLVGGALKHALDIFEWMASNHRISDPLPADIETFNTLIKACHQVMTEEANRVAHIIIYPLNTPKADPTPLH